MDLQGVYKSVLYLPSLICFTSFNFIYSTFFVRAAMSALTCTPTYYEDMNRYSHTITFITSCMNKNTRSHKLKFS